MANKKGFESFEQSSKVPETFYFPESENQKQILTSDYVFKFEDNVKQTGLDDNIGSLGDEENASEESKAHEADTFERREQEQKAEESAESGTSSTTTASASTSSAASSTAASSASTTVATVAATTTAAVVLVVGGGIVIYGQTVDRPNICEFNEVTVVENSVNFKLSLGNDREKIDNGEEDTECDITIDLLCPSIEDFEEKHIAVNKFGKVEGEFTELEYDTEYLLNVAQHVMMSADYEYLLEEPVSFKTAALQPEPEPEPEPEPAPFIISKELDPMGGGYYYLEIDSSVSIPEYDSYIVGMYPIDNPNPIHYEDGDNEQPQYVVWSEYDPSLGKQQLEMVNELEKPYYHVDFFGYTAEFEEIKIVESTVASNDFIVSDVDLSNPYIFFNLEYDTRTSTTTYYAYVNYPYPESLDFDSYSGLILSNNQDDDDMPFEISAINEKIEVELMFDEYDWPKYDTYDVQVNGYYATSQDARTIFTSTINFRLIPSHDYESSESNHIDIIDKLDPMNGNNYFALVHYVNEMPSYSHYGVALKGSDDGHPSSDAGWDVISEYDINNENEQPLYVSGSLDSPYYEVAFVGYEEPADLTIIYSESQQTSDDFITTEYDLFDNLIFFGREYDIRTEILHTYTYVNIPDNPEFYSRLTGRISDPDNPQTSMPFTFNNLNAKEEITLDFEQYGLSESGIYNVTVTAYSSDGGTTETIIDTIVDFGLVPYSTYTSSDPNSITIYEQVDPTGGYSYYVDVVFVTEIPDDFVEFTVRIRDAEILEDEWQIISPYDLSTGGIQRLTSAVEQLSLPEYVVTLYGVDSDENEVQLYATLIESSDFVEKPVGDEDAIYFLREIDTTTLTNTYYAYLQYSGDTTYLSEISGFIVDVEDQTGSIAGTFSLSAFNSKVLCEFTWNNSSEYSTYKVTVQAVDRSSATSSQLVTLLDSVVIDFGEMPVVSIASSHFFGASFNLAESASIQSTFALVDLDYADPNNIWSNFAIVITYSDEPDYTYNYNLVQYPYNPTGTNRYYLDGFTDIEQRAFYYSITASVDDGEGVITNETIYESDTLVSFYGGVTYTINGSFSPYTDTYDGSEYIFFNVVNNDSYLDDYVSIEIELVNINDATDTHSYALQVATDLNNYRTDLLADDVRGNDYKATVTGYDSSGGSKVIFTEKLMLAQA